MTFELEEMRGQLITALKHPALASISDYNKIPFELSPNVATDDELRGAIKLLDFLIRGRKH